MTSGWSAYGQANLQSATLSLWTQNGTSRSFDVSGLDDGAGLEGWSSGSLSWNNAPGNDPSSEWALDWTKIYGGAPVWQARGGGVAAPSTAYANNAYYMSDDLSAFLATDTDGLVTFITSGPDGINSNTRFWSIAGAWQTDPAQISPILTLTFVPEPGSFSLALLGMGGLFFIRRRA